jgi:hypothetical protein
MEMKTFVTTPPKKHIPPPWGGGCQSTPFHIFGCTRISMKALVVDLECFQTIFARYRAGLSFPRNLRKKVSEDKDSFFSPPSTLNLSHYFFLPINTHLK